MKAITLTQPYATLVAVGAKRIETRSWSTSFRGPLAIHAAAGYGRGGMKAHKALCGEEPFCSVLNAACARHYAPWSSLKDIVEHPFMPMGAIVAVAKLVSIDEILPGDEEPSNIYRIIGGKRLHWPLTEQERAFGDYSAGRFAWLLGTVRALPEPIPAKGALGLWEWTPPPDWRMP